MNVESDRHYDQNNQDPHNHLLRLLESFGQFVSSTSNPGPGYYETDTYKKIGGVDSIKTSIRGRYYEAIT